MGWGDLVPYQVVLLVTVIKLAICLYEMDVTEMNTLAIRSLMSDNYTTIKKLNARHSQKFSLGVFSPHCGMCTYSL